MAKVRDIHESLVNGQRRQMVKQIERYGEYDFFSNYFDYLNETIMDAEVVLQFFSDATISFHRLKNR